MSTRTEAWPAGTPCWIDLSVPDVPAAVAFYSDVVGWTFVDTGADYGGYQIGQVDGRAGAGVGPLMQEGQPAAWTMYFASDDADATVERVTRHGGAVLGGPMDIPGTGRMAIAADPTGAVFGVWQQAGMIGCEVQDEPGSFAWDDARLTDPAAGKRFYADVFGVTFSALPPEVAGDEMADYETFELGDPTRPLGGVGGMWDAAEGTRSHWLVYLSVADVDAAVAAVGDGGGTVVRPPESTPFGRMAVVADPFGAVFALHAPPPGEGADGGVGGGNG